MSATLTLILAMIEMAIKIEPDVAKFFKDLKAGDPIAAQRIADILPEHSESEAAEALILAQDAAHKTDPAPAPKL